MIERLVVTSPWALIGTDCLLAALRASPREDEEADLDMKARVAHFERQLVQEAVERFGNTRAAAKQMKISQSTIVRRLKAGRTD
jgi:transcriptional regulator with PAS, ATPase and Fis domain